tara:strand:- start:948 stop:1112 length:165 start_codon:yes stop_codon:yes gene_type:complete
MIETALKNQVLMTFLISSIWFIPGVAFVAATKRKYNYRKKEKQLKKISNLYPQP